jgi:hypothetical protein
MNNFASIGSPQVSSENTVLLPFNFNNYPDCDDLIEIYNHHLGNIQDSIAFMLRTLKATQSNNLEISLSKIISLIKAQGDSSTTNSSVQDLQTQITKLLNENSELKLKLSDLETKEGAKVLPISKFEETPPAPQSSNINEITSTTVSDNLKEQIQTEPVNSGAQSEDLIRKQDDGDLSSYFATEDEKHSNPTDFNQIYKNAKYPYIKRFSDDLLTPEAKQEEAYLNKLQTLSSKLELETDPDSFKSSLVSDELDLILAKALNNLKENDQLDLPTEFDDDAKDACLKEALSLYEQIDKQSFPELYEIDKNSITVELEKRLAAKRLGLRINRYRSKDISKNTHSSLLDKSKLDKTDNSGIIAVQEHNNLAANQKMAVPTALISQKNDDHDVNASLKPSGEELKEQQSGSNESANPNLNKFDHTDPMSGAFENLDTLGTSPEKKENDNKAPNENDFENKGSPMDLDGYVQDSDHSNLSNQTSDPSLSSSDDNGEDNNEDTQNSELSKNSTTQDDDKSISPQDTNGSNNLKKNLFALAGGNLSDDEQDHDDEQVETNNSQVSNDLSKIDNMLKHLTFLKTKNPNEIIDLDLNDLNLLGMLKPWERLFHKKRCLIKMSIDNAISVLEDHKKDDHDLLAKLVTFNRNSKWKYNPNSQDSIE